MRHHTAARARRHGGEPADPTPARPRNTPQPEPAGTRMGPYCAQGAVHHGSTGHGSTRYERGAAVLETLSPGQAARLRAELGDGAPEMARLVVEFPFGDVYSRPGLDLRSRQLATVAMLAALGNAAPQLAVHLRAALHLGWTRAELTELLIQVAVYAGFPASLNALAVAREAFADGAAPSGPPPPPPPPPQSTATHSWETHS